MGSEADARPQCCNPKLDGGWGVFNSLFGWQNSATYGSVISYNVYWIVVMVIFMAMRLREKRCAWPFMPAKKADKGAESDSDLPSSDLERSLSRGEEKADPNMETA